MSVEGSWVRSFTLAS